MTIEALFVCDHKTTGAILAEARRALEREAYNMQGDEYASFELADHLPEGWTEDCMVYGDRSADMTAREALALNKKGEEKP
jgi:hypothetical protein